MSSTCKAWKRGIRQATCFGVLSSKTREQYPVTTEEPGTRRLLPSSQLYRQRCGSDFQLPNLGRGKDLFSGSFYTGLSKQFLILENMDLRASFFQGLGILHHGFQLSAFWCVWKVCLFKTLKAHIIIYSHS